MTKIKKIFSIILIISLSSTVKGTAEINDGLYITVGNKAVTKSDVVDEIKKILILNNVIYSEDKREELHQLAVKSVIKLNVKKIEVERNDFLEFSKNDLNNELTRMANNLDMDLDTLKSVFSSNELDFSIVEDQIKTELLWNSLIFYLYRNRISINLSEIDEQLRLNQNKEEFMEYLISEIVIKAVEKDKLESKIEEVKNKINIEGFESVAMNLSISQTASKGGDLGWVNENVISEKYKSKISKTTVGSLSEPILLNEGILIFKVRDKRKIEKEIDLEELKNQMVSSEKTKILNMYSMTHYDNVRRTISINFFDD